MLLAETEPAPLLFNHVAPAPTDKHLKEAARYERASAISLHRETYPLRTGILHEKTKPENDGCSSSQDRPSIYPVVVFRKIFATARIPAEQRKVGAYFRLHEIERISPLLLRDLVFRHVMWFTTQRDRNRMVALQKAKKGLITQEAAEEIDQSERHVVSLNPPPHTDLVKGTFLLCLDKRKLIFASMLNLL